jgi:hypothetical protein
MYKIIFFREFQKIQIDPEESLFEITALVIMICSVTAVWMDVCKIALFNKVCVFN